MRRSGHRTSRFSDDRRHDFLDPAVIQGIIDHVPVPSRFENPTGFQNAELLGSEGLLGAERFHELSDGALSIHENVHDLQADGMCNGLEGFGHFLERVLSNQVERGACQGFSFREMKSMVESDKVTKFKKS